SWHGMGFPFRERLDWMQALTGLSSEEREYIRRLRREKESLRLPGRVVLSTIHGAKGGEADNVLLLPDCNNKVLQAVVKDKDQESRVWFVGMTRSKSALFWVLPVTKRYFDHEIW